jgi:hypothetical protein
MIPPLASIIGSGFLIAGPLLGRALAYAVAVAHYLTLLGSFHVEQATWQTGREAARWIATALVLPIAGAGRAGGLRRVIAAERHVVAFQPAVIAGFLAALAGHAVAVARDGGAAALLPVPPEGGAGSLPVLLGLLIVVQGFETSRYLGDAFDRGTRIRTMSKAQWVTAAIYLLFFLLLLPVLPAAMQGAGETSILALAATVGALLPAMPTAGAAASQFSSAVADTIGSSGLASGLAGERAGPRRAFPVLGAATLAMLWTTDIFGVIALASRAFAVYYVLQCLLAAAEVQFREGVSARAAGFAARAALAGAAAVFGVRAE